MLDLANIRCFVAVADELHFGRAAERLNMTQPPLSRRIQLLERSLGVQLLQRTNRRVALTADGRRFLNEARSLLRQADQAERSVKRTSAADKGQLAIAFTAVSGYRYIPRVVVRLQAAMPNVELRLSEHVSAEQIEGVQSGRFDIGFVRLKVRDAALRSRPCHRERLVLALPKKHRLCAADGITLGDIAAERLIGYDPTLASYFFDLLQYIFRRAGLSPNYVQYLVHAHSALALVSAGVGVAIVPESAASLRFRGVVTRPIDLGGDYPVELETIWREGNLNPMLPLALQSIGA